MTPSHSATVVLDFSHAIIVDLLLQGPWGFRKVALGVTDYYAGWEDVNLCVFLPEVPPELYQECQKVLTTKNIRNRMKSDRDLKPGLRWVILMNVDFRKSDAQCGLRIILKYQNESQMTLDWWWWAQSKLISEWGELAEKQVGFHLFSAHGIAYHLFPLLFIICRW